MSDGVTRDMLVEARRPVDAAERRQRDELRLLLTVAALLAAEEPLETKPLTRRQAMLQRALQPFRAELAELAAGEAAEC